MIKNTAESTRQENEISSSRDTIRGYLAIASATAGWSNELATVVARLAEPVVSARLVEGLEAEDAINRTLSEMDALMAIEVFSVAMQTGATAEAAFDMVADLKSVGMADQPGSDVAMVAARKSFRLALETGLSPAAALLAANMLAGAAATLDERTSH